MANRMDKMSADLERIAREILDLETLETRKSDSLDFREQAVWTLRRALEAAYEAGRAARQDQADVFVPTELPAPRRARKRILGPK
jgi:hypothetical protein